MSVARHFDVQSSYIKQYLVKKKRVTIYTCLLCSASWTGVDSLSHSSLIRLRKRILPGGGGNLLPRLQYGGDNQIFDNVVTT